MTYTIDPSCNNEEYFLAPIRIGLEAWSIWLFGYVDFAAMADNPRLIFQCYFGFRTPHGNIDDYTAAISNGYFVAPAWITLSVQQPAITEFGVKHELGHALGLKEGSGLMDTSPTYYEIANGVPSSEDLRSIMDAYGPLVPVPSVTVPEFPASAVAFVLALSLVVLAIYKPYE